MPAKTSRRHALTLLGASTTALALGLVGEPARATAGDAVSYAAGRFAFGIDGEFAGFIKSATARDVDVVDALRATQPSATQLATISHEPLTLELAPRPGPMFEWVRRSFDEGYAPRSLTLRGDGSALTLRDVSIESLRVPALEGTNKDAMYWTVAVTHGGASTATRGLTTPSDGRPWLRSSFRLEIDGLPCDRVAKIDSFTLAAARPAEEESQWPGAQKLPTRPPTTLRLTIDARDLKPWQAWRDQARALGYRLAPRVGAVRLIGPEGQELRVRLSGVRVDSLENVAPRADGVARFDVQLRAEAFALELVEPG